MRIKLVESSGHPYNKVRDKVEKMISSLSSDGFDFNMYRTLDRNKFESHYFGRYNDKPFTLIANTTHRSLNEGPEDVFFTLSMNGKIYPLGPANSKNKDDLHELLEIHFNELENEKKAAEDEENRRNQLAQEEKDREAAEKHSKWTEDEARRIQKDKEDLALLSDQYKELTGKELPEDIEVSDAEDMIVNATFISEIPLFIQKLNSAGFQSDMTVSFQNSNESLSGYIDILRLTNNQYLINDKRPDNTIKDKVMTQKQTIDLLEEQVTKNNCRPSVVNIRDKDNQSVDFKMYK